MHTRTRARVRDWLPKTVMSNEWHPSVMHGCMPDALHWQLNPGFAVYKHMRAWKLLLLRTYIYMYIAYIRGLIKPMHMYGKPQSAKALLAGMTAEHDDADSHIV